MSESAVSGHPGLSMQAKDQCAAGLAHVAQLLHAEFDEALGSLQVDTCIAEVTATFADATVLSFVPLLVRRYAREELLGRAAAIPTGGLPTEAALLAQAP